MTLNIRNISRRFGALGTVLTNRKGRLYIYVIVSFLLAGIISFGFWYGASSGVKYLHQQQYNREATVQKQQCDSAAKEIQKKIDENAYTAAQVSERFGDRHENEYTLFTVSSKGITEDESKEGYVRFDQFIRHMYIYPTEFANGSGYIVMNPTPNEGMFEAAEMGVNVITALMFALISFLLLRRRIKYIEEINEGIKKFSRGQLDHNIPIKGKDELTNVALSMNQMSDSLDAKIRKERLQEKKQRKLITDVSHDLRTPLTAMIGYLRILSDNGAKDGEETKKYLSKAWGKSMEMQSLLDELFTYARLTNGDVDHSISKIRLDTFVRQYLELQETDVTVEGDDKIEVMADTVWLRRIMDNLFDNIRKHGTPDEQVRLTLSQDDGYAYLALANETEDDLSEKVDLLFDRMYVSEESRTDQSSGLGLAIVAEAMKAMNGTAYAEFSDGMLKIILKFPKE